MQRVLRTALRFGSGRAALASSALLLAACASAPLSFFNDGYVYYRAQLNRFPLIVIAVDGSSSLQRPLPVSPGLHEVKLAAVPVAGFRIPLEKTYPITVAPCTRYYLAAQRASPLLQDWDLVVEYTEPVSGCDPAREIEKARTMAISGAPTAASSSIAAAPLTPR